MQVHPDDMRKKQIFLTDAGRTLYLDVIAAMEGPIAELTAGIKDIQAILPVLEELRKRRDENRDV